VARAPLSLKARAIGLLAQREHSRAELRRKLLRIEQQRLHSAAMAALAVAPPGATAASAAGASDPVEHPDDDEDVLAGSCEALVDALLDALVADGYLDETRFVESRLHVRAGRFGTQRIQQELAQHGLRMDAEQQQALRSTELERAREVWRKRFGPDLPTDATERARQTRFLLARGFAADTVRRVLRCSTD
jgi:regulatory protein